MRLPLFICLLLTINAAEAQSPLAPEDVFKLNFASSPAVSPDGSFIIYSHNFMDIMEDRRRANLWRIDTLGGNARPVTTGAVNDSGAKISPDGTRLAYLSSDDKGTQIFMRWLESGETLQLTRLPSSPGDLAWSADGKWLAYTSLAARAKPTMGELPTKPEGAEWAEPPIVVDRSVFRVDGAGTLPLGYTQVFVVPSHGGAPRQLTSGDYNHGGAISWAKDSKSLYFSGNRNDDWELNPNNSDIYRIGIGGGEVTTVTDRVGPDNGVSVSPDGRQLAWRGYDDKRMSYQRSRLYLMDVDGENRRELLQDLDRSIDHHAWAADGRGLYIQYDDEGMTRLAHVSTRGKLTQVSDKLSGLSLGRPYTGAAFAVGGRNTYAFTLGDSMSPADIASGRGVARATKITQLSENLLSHKALAPAQEMWVKSKHDGRQIQAWLVRPPGFDASKKYPLLLEIHGGPHTAYGPHFAAELQLLAAAGYVVVYANPRGSTSYGEEFAQLIHHNYPSEDYDDLMSVVDSVIEQGAIDTDQLYVTGGSGGGVLTAWIVGKTQRFRAAVVAKPVINWISHTLSAHLPPFFTQYWFPKMPWEDPMGYWKRSPLSLVGNVNTPTMLLTGEQDWRTPMWESEQYYQALKLRGIDTALVRIPGASHSITKRPSQMIAKVQAILAWFDRHSGRQPEVTNSP